MRRPILCSDTLKNPRGAAGRLANHETTRTFGARHLRRLHGRLVSSAERTPPLRSGPSKRLSQRKQGRESHRHLSPARCYSPRGRQHSAPCGWCRWGPPRSLSPLGRRRTWALDGAARVAAFLHAKWLPRNLRSCYASNRVCGSSNP